MVVSSRGQAYAQPAQYMPTSSSTSKYHAQSSRGQPIPVVAGVSYRDEGIPLSTRIRRLFGLGPKRSRGHVGRSVHVKRWGVGGPGFTTADTGHRSQASVYTV